MSTDNWSSIVLHRNVPLICCTIFWYQWTSHTHIKTLVVKMMMMQGVCCARLVWEALPLLFRLWSEKWIHWTEMNKESRSNIEEYIVKIVRCLKSLHQQEFIQLSQITLCTGPHHYWCVQIHISADSNCLVLRSNHSTFPSCAGSSEMGAAELLINCWLHLWRGCYDSSQMCRENELQCK